MRWEAAEAVLFDLDGVLTPTAAVHMAAWAALFTPFLAERAVRPAYGDADYFAHLDGRPRYDGVRSLLGSRGIHLPEGLPTDPPGATTVCGLGNAKDATVAQLLATRGLTAYPGSVRVLDQLERHGVPAAVVSSSRNTGAVLERAGLSGRFAVVVDGLVADDEGLRGKPAPDTFLLAARWLRVPPERCAVVEDAVSGVAAGRAGGFGLVIGVDRGAGAGALRGAGADLVVEDLGELLEPVVPDPPGGADS